MVARIALVLVSVLLIQSLAVLGLGVASDIARETQTQDQAFHECCLQERLLRPKSRCASCYQKVATTPKPELVVESKSTLGEECYRDHTGKCRPTSDESS